MINEKKVSKSGSITIPSHLRRQLGLIAGEKVKIEQDAEGNFFVKRIEGSCIFCGINEKLAKVKGKFICVNCIEEIFGKRREEKQRDENEKN